MVRRGGHFYKALCVNALSLGRVPHLADANTLGQLSVLYLLVASKFCIYASENTSSMSLDCELQKVFLFFSLLYLYFLALHSCLHTGSQYITCKLQNCSDGNKGKPFPGFIIPNSLVVQDEYVFIQVGFIARSGFIKR